MRLFDCLDSIPLAELEYRRRLGLGACGQAQIWLLLSHFFISSYCCQAFTQ